LTKCGKQESRLGKAVQKGYTGGGRRKEIES
jgi:hypothetical protein